MVLENKGVFLHASSYLAALVVLPIKVPRTEGPFHWHKLLPAARSWVPKMLKAYVISEEARTS